MGPFGNVSKPVEFTSSHSCVKCWYLQLSSLQMMVADREAWILLGYDVKGTKLLLYC